MEAADKGCAVPDDSVLSYVKVRAGLAKNGSMQSE